MVEITPQLMVVLVVVDTAGIIARDKMDLLEQDLEVVEEVPEGGNGGSGRCIGVYPTTAEGPPT